MTDKKKQSTEPLFPVPAWLMSTPNALTESLRAQQVRLVETGLCHLFEKIVSLGHHHAGFEILNGAVATTLNLPGAKELAHELIPWRKGPFKLGELFLDAEWRSDIKWHRLQPHLPSLEGKVVADVGCNNGYYLYRIAEAGAAKIVGLDPTLKYYLQYRLIAAHTGSIADFLPLGWQALWQMPDTFDVVFLMGVNYHDPEPLEIFHACRAALRKGGVLFCESVVIPTEVDLEIFPAGRYAGIGGVHAIPSVRALVRQLAFAGFSTVEPLYSVPLEPYEQRSTPFSPQPSLAAYLRHDGLTKEGYPAPYRAAIRAYK